MARMAIIVDARDHRQTVTTHTAHCSGQSEKSTSSQMWVYIDTGTCLGPITFVLKLSCIYFLLCEIVSGQFVCRTEHGSRSSQGSGPVQGTGHARAMALARGW